MRVRPDTSTLKAGVTQAVAGLKPLNLKVVTDSATATRGMDAIRAATLRVVAAQERLDVLRASGNASVGKIASAEAGLLSSQGALVRTQSKVTEEAHKSSETLHAGLLRGSKDILGLRSYITQLGSTIAGVFVADKIVGFFRDSVKAAGEAQIAQTKLANSIKNNTLLSETSAEAFNRQGDALVRLTGFTAPVITSGQAMLGSFKLNQNQIETLTPLVLDLSRKMGIDVPMAARLVGRAASGAGNGMARMGVVIDKAKYSTDAFGATVDAVRTKAGGFADAYGKTVPGQVDRAKASFQLLEEELGAKLLPVFGKLAGFLVNDVIPALMAAGHFYMQNRDVINAFVSVIGAAVVAWGAYTAVVKIAAAAQAVFDAALVANPIGIAVVALAALAAGLVYAYKNSETFRVIVQTAFRVVKTVAVDAFTWIRDHWQLLLSILGGPVGAAAVLIITHFGTIKTAAVDMWHVLQTAFRDIVDAFLSVAGTIIHGAATIFGWVPGVGGKLKAAAAAFDQFRDDVNAALGGIIKHWDFTVAGMVTLNGRAAPVSIVGAAARFGFARGGPVAGPGGPVGDMIPAFLSNGEYVMNAAATKRWRPLLDRLNAVGMAQGGPARPATRERAGISYNATIYADSKPEQIANATLLAFRRMELLHL